MPLLLFSAAAYSQGAIATAGKQRAANSLLEWEIREANHPSLGQIRFAFLKTQIVSSVGSVKVFTRPYVSCEKSTGKIAIEVAHGMTPEDTRGLMPKSVPRLVCSGPPPTGEKKLVQEELVARWGINDLGDVLARGLMPADLRRCASILVDQDVTLPQAPGTAHVEFEITPYNRVMDAVFVACGETTAYGPGAMTLSRQAAAVPPAAAAPPPPPPPALSEDGWRSVRTLSSGKTNVRARPSTNAPLVLQLEPGAMVTVQLAEGDWWRARSSGKRTFDGYIRSDRLVLK